MRESTGIHRLDCLPLREPVLSHFEDGVLKFEFRKGGTAKQRQRARFIEVVGSTLLGKLPKELEERRVKLLENLGPTWRRKVTEWNKQHPRSPIETWPEALKSRSEEMSGLRHYIQKLFSRRAREYREKHAKATEPEPLDYPFVTGEDIEKMAAEEQRRRDEIRRRAVGRYDR